MLVLDQCSFTEIISFIRRNICILKLVLRRNRCRDCHSRSIPTPLDIGNADADQGDRKNADDGDEDLDHAELVAKLPPAFLSTRSSLLATFLLFLLHFASFSIFSTAFAVFIILIILIIIFCAAFFTFAALDVVTLASQNEFFGITFEVLVVFRQSSRMIVD